MDRRRNACLALFLGVCVMAAGPAAAQYQVKIGIKQTSGRWQDTLLAGETNTLTISITNPVSVAAYVIPLVVKAQTFSAFARPGDSLSTVYIGRMATPNNPFSVRSTNSKAVNGTSPDSILFGAVEFGSNFLLAGTGIVMEHPLMVSPFVGSVRIDSALLPPSNHLSFSLPDGSEITNVVFNSNPVFPVVLRVPNAGPTCTNPSNINSHFGTPLAKLFTATDPEGNPLTFKQASGPGTTTAAGNWSWTPGCPQVGTHQVCVTVSDPNHKDWDTCCFTVTVTQSAPTLSCTNKVVHYGDTLDFIVNASDDGCPSALKYFKTSGPGALNTNTGRFFYTPLCSDKGVKIVQMGVTDGRDTILCNFTITVTNSAPVINCPPNFSSGINDTVKFQLSASDPDGDPITCTLLSFTKLSGPTGGGPNFPPVLTSGCLFTWPTSDASNNDDFGVWRVRLRVDEPCDSAFCTFEIEITPNRPPVCTPPPNQTLHWSVGSASAQFSMFDPDGDAITISQISGPGSTNASGLWSWSGFGCAQRGIYQVCAVVADSAFPQGDTCCFQVTIEQTPPDFNCRDTAIHSGTGPLSMQFSAPDDGCPGNPVRYHKISGQGQIDSVTGLYTLFSLLPDFDCGDLGSYPVSISATDGELTGLCDFIVTVFNNPPAFACPFDDTLEHVTDRLFTYNSFLQDPDGDALTQVLVRSFTKLSGPPGGPTHPPSVNGQGIVTWVTDSSTNVDLGKWRMILEARDTCAVSRCTLFVIVVHNRPPVCFSGNTAGHQGDTARGAVLGVDPDGDSLTFVQISGPGFIIQESNVARWKWLTNCSNVGTYQVCVKVSDQKFIDADTCCFMVTIFETPPVVYCSTQTVHYGNTLLYDIAHVDDACPQAATWSLLSGPGSINPVTGRYTLPTQCALKGTHPVTVRLFDGIRADTCMFNVNVTNTKPFVNCPPNQVGIKVGATVNLNIPFGDVDGDATTISLVSFQKLGGMNFNPPNNPPTLSPAGVFNWVTNQNNVNDVATWEVRLRVLEVCDSDFCSFRIEILPNLAPVCTSPSDYEGGCDTLHSVTFLATDDENNTIVYTQTSGPGTTNPANGHWTWTPPCDSDGVHEVCVAVGDFLHLVADTCCYRFSVCAVTERGDVNGNGLANSEDIIIMVNFMFKSQQMPYGPYTADMNCDGVTTAADIIILVNYVFKNGALPCNACSSPLFPGL